MRRWQREEMTAASVIEMREARGFAKAPTLALKRDPTSSLGLPISASFPHVISGQSPDCTCHCRLPLPSSRDSVFVIAQ